MAMTTQQTPVAGSLVVPWRGADRRWAPHEGPVTFGRNSEVVDLCVGENDRGVSREHVLLTFREGLWWLRNTGQRQVEIDDVQTIGPYDEEAALPDGYSSLRVHGANTGHTIEVLVVGPDEWEPTGPSRSTTIPVRGWPLHRRERLAVVAIAEFYLRGEPDAEPRTWRQAAEVLGEADADGNWTHRSVEHVVGGVRMRMAAKGEEGLVAGEEKVAGDTLKRNLIKILRDSGTISRRDLGLIDPDDEP